MLCCAAGSRRQPAGLSMLCDWGICIRIYTYTRIYACPGACTYTARAICWLAGRFGHGTYICTSTCIHIYMYLEYGFIRCLLAQKHIRLYR